MKPGSLFESLRNANFSYLEDGTKSGEGPGKRERATGASPSGVVNMAEETILEN